MSERNPRFDGKAQKPKRDPPGKATPQENRNNPGCGKLLPFLPPGTDCGDLLLFVLLLLLYNESGDEEYLIILAAVFFMN